MLSIMEGGVDSVSTNDYYTATELVTTYTETEITTSANPSKTPTPSYYTYTTSDLVTLYTSTATTTTTPDDDPFFSKFIFSLYIINTSQKVRWFRGQ